MPTKLSSNLCRVNCVAPVVPRSVLLERLQATICGDMLFAQRLVLRRGENCFQSLAKPVDDLQVCALVATADVVLLTRAPTLENEGNPGAVILDIQPVPHVAAI